MAGQATATSTADRTASEARRPEAGMPGRRRQGCGRLAIASPVRDERAANLQQPGPRSGDARDFRLLFRLDDCFWLKKAVNPDCLEQLSNAS